MYQQRVQRNYDRYLPSGEDILINDARGVGSVKCKSCTVCCHTDPGVAERVVYSVSLFNALMAQCERERDAGNRVESAYSLPTKISQEMKLQPPTVRTKRKPTFCSELPRILLHPKRPEEAEAASALVEPADRTLRQRERVRDVKAELRRTIASGGNRTFERLDIALDEAISFGWPEWITP